LIADFRNVVDQLERVDIDDMRRRLAALEQLLAPPDPRPMLRLIEGGRHQPGSEDNDLHEAAGVGLTPSGRVEPDLRLCVSVDFGPPE
jgi:hypothetical protein